MGKRIRLAGFFLLLFFLRGGEESEFLGECLLSSAVKSFCFEYQHLYSDAKNENLQKQLDEKGEMGKHQYGLH